MNVGIREAKTPYVILLNNDTEPEPAYVEELVRAMDRSAKIFSVSSKMIQLYQKDKMDDAGDMYTVLGLGLPAGEWGGLGEIPPFPGRVLRLRRSCHLPEGGFEKIGLFDEMHFAYLEDLDIGYRARLAGYDNVYCPKRWCTMCGERHQRLQVQFLQGAPGGPEQYLPELQEYAGLAAGLKRRSHFAGDGGEVPVL